MDNEHQEEQLLRDNDHSTTNTKEIKCSCRWTIYNFSFFAQGDKSSFAPNYAPDIESPLFKYGCNNDLIWDLNIVNLRNLDEEYLKIYVYVNDSEWHDYYSIDVKVSILDDKGREAYSIKYKPSILSTDCIDFIRKDYLTNKNNRLLTDDKLVIVCEISAVAEIYTYSWDAEDDEDDLIKDRDCEVDIFKSRLQVSKDLKALSESNASDSTVIVKKKQFYTHKCILVARSRVFSAMFEQEMLEQVSNLVTIKDISSMSFEYVKEFIYSGRIEKINDIHNSVLMDILFAADKYEFNALKEICECVLSTKLFISNTVEMLKIADSFHADKLKKFVIQFIVAHKRQCESDPEFELLLNTHGHLIDPIFQAKSEAMADESLDVTNDSDNQENTVGNCINHIHLEPFKSPLEGNQWSVTEIGTEEGSCTWNIKQIGIYYNNDLCDYLISDKFTKDKVNISWQLFLYFKGVDYESKDYISLLIQFFDGHGCKHRMQAQYEFAIINGKGEKVNRMKSDLLNFSLNNSKLGEARFIKRDLLFNKRKNFLQNDAFVINCNIKFGLNTQRRYYQSDALHYCEHKFLLSVSDDLEHLLENGKLSDIKLSVKGKEFSVHRAILTARSPLLLCTIDQLFETQKNKIVEMNDIDPVVFQNLLLFIYSGKVNSLKELTKSLHAEATRFKLEDLKSICEAYLCKNLTLENVCDNFVFAHTNNVRKLRAKCSLFITDNLKAVIATAGYKSLADSRPRLLKDLLLNRHN